MGFDLKKQLVFYGAYHREPTNVAIHITCVPLLLASAFFLGTNTPALPLPATSPATQLLTRANLPPNLTTLAGLTYTTAYLTLSPNLAGGTLAPLILATSALCNRLHARLAATNPSQLSRLNKAAVALHVVSWIAQFIGHGKFEGRKPALLDNLVQALGLAPLFVWYEVLFKFGFYKKLRLGIEKGVEEEVKKLEGKGE